jgi:hypothetical protein
MKQKAIKILTLILLSGLLITGCELLQCDCYCTNYTAGELKLNETVDLAYNEMYCNSNYEIRISFDSLQDSRCPIGALCVWEGNARVKVYVQQSGIGPAAFWLNTNVQFLTDTVVNGLRYELIDVLPYPEMDKEYQPDDYILQMHISD